MRGLKMDAMQKFDDDYDTTTKNIISIHSLIHSLIHSFIHSLI
jgi:hypothetical protein